MEQISFLQSHLQGASQPATKSIPRQEGSRFGPKFLGQGGGSCLGTQAAVDYQHCKGLLAAVWSRARRLGLSVFDSAYPSTATAAVSERVLMSQAF